MSKVLSKHPKVDEWERDGYFIDMKQGWTIDAVASKYGDGVHCFGADTLKESLETLRMAVPCKCPSCCETSSGESSGLGYMQGRGAS